MADNENPAQEASREPPAGEEYDPLVGSTLAERYEIVRRIGEGGMGAVYEARHTVIGKRVAVKVLLERLVEKPELVRRLLQEARMASSIGHANIVDVTDFGTTEDGRSFVVMEFLEGEPLSALLAREAPLPVARCLYLISQVASALHAAHEKGIVHRDIKPENVYLIRRDDQDFVKVVDFGVSKAVRGGEETGESLRLTRTGTVLGTPLYMSPEQARGDEDIDARADVWALAVLLYECLTGEVPFRARNYLQVISQVLSNEVIPPSQLQPELGIPDAVDAIVMRGLAKTREERYQRIADIEEDIKRLLSGDQNVGAVVPAGEAGGETTATEAGGTRWSLAVAGILAVGIGLAVALARIDPPPAEAPVAEPSAKPAQEPSLQPSSEPVVAPTEPMEGVAGVPVAGPTGGNTGTLAAEATPTVGGLLDPLRKPGKRGGKVKRGGKSQKGGAGDPDLADPGDGVIRIGDDIVPGPEKAYRKAAKR